MVQDTDNARTVPTLSILLAHGLDPNMREAMSGESVLSFPVLLHNDPVAKGLVEVGADVWARKKGPDSSTMIGLAIESGGQDFVVWLVGRGAFDHRSEGELEGVLRMLAADSPYSPAMVAANRRVARAILDRTGTRPDAVVQSFLAETARDGR